MGNKLAINGGEKITTKLLPNQNTMSAEETIAMHRVMNLGRLSGYRANKGDHFFGGPEIQTFEKEWSNYFNVKHSVACNSATSGLFIACAAIGLKPGDEVIVTPYSMTCSATVPLWFGAKPVFADVEKDYFCIDPESIRNKITQKTKAIIAVDIFGQPCDYDAIKDIIDTYEELIEHRIYLITDTAQAPGSKYKGQASGTIGDIGVFSFNFGKHMTCGEGGMICTNDSSLNINCRAIMNHAESVNNDYYDSCKSTLTNAKMIGLNFRMSELHAAIARIQLTKLRENIYTRLENVKVLNTMLSDIPAITVAPIRKNCTHSYYVSAYLWDDELANGLHRDDFINAVKAELTAREGRDGEGVQIGCGYIKPINQMPCFFGSEQSRADLPVVNDLWKNKLFLTIAHAPNSTKNDMVDIGKAFIKVWENRGEV